MLFNQVYFTSLFLDKISRQVVDATRIKKIIMLSSSFFMSSQIRLNNLFKKAVIIPVYSPNILQTLE